LAYDRILRKKGKDLVFFAEDRDAKRRIGLGESLRAVERSGEKPGYGVVYVELDEKGNPRWIAR
jgi:hypothetical protein